MRYNPKLLLIIVVLLWSGCRNISEKQNTKSEVVEAIGATDTLASAAEYEKLDDYFTFLIASDLGRNGYFDQQPIAETMGIVANLADAEFVAAIGDVHHFMGVGSVNDPLWLTNFEWVYKHPELQIPWYPVLGNHEYEGNTDAVIEYSKISRRWQMPDRYYSKSIRISDNTELLLVFIDTPPLIDKYRQSEEHPDARKQDADKQLRWIDNTLKSSTAKWKIVMGHHPVYAGTNKEEEERIDMQLNLMPLLKKHQVDAYYCGHIHNFQHIKMPGVDIDYFVNSSASLSREVVPLKEAIFSSQLTGFTLCSLNDSLMVTSLIDKKGGIIYQYTRKE